MTDEVQEMAMRIASMDFGRIGRNYLRAALAQEGQFEVVAVNDLSDTATRAHLMEYDSLSGRLGKVVDVHDRNMIVAVTPIQIFGEWATSRTMWQSVCDLTVMHAACA